MRKLVGEHGIMRQLSSTFQQLKFGVECLIFYLWPAERLRNAALVFDICLSSWSITGWTMWKVQLKLGWLVSALTSALQPNIFIVFRKPRASVLRNDKTLVNSPSSTSEKSSPTWEAPKKLQDKGQILSVHVRYSTKPSIYAWRKQSPLTCSKVDSRTSRSYELPVARPDEQGKDYSRN